MKRPERILANKKTCVPSLNTIETELYRYDESRIDCDQNDRQIVTRCDDEKMTFKILYEWGVRFSIDLYDWPKDILKGTQCVNPIPEDVIRKDAIVDVSWSDAMSESFPFNSHPSSQNFICDPVESEFMWD
jgi:hypothetical protein